MEAARERISPHISLDSFRRKLLIFPCCHASSEPNIGFLNLSEQSHREKSDDHCLTCLRLAPEVSAITDACVEVNAQKKSGSQRFLGGSLPADLPSTDHCLLHPLLLALVNPHFNFFSGDFRAPSCRHDLWETQAARGRERVFFPRLLGRTGRRL